MGFIVELLKTIATFVGFLLSVGGFFGFFGEIFLILSEDHLSDGIILTVVSVLAFTIGTILGKYARGDYD